MSLSAEPRRCAKKNIYVIGGSQRELGSAWTKSECTYHTVEVFDSFKVKKKTLIRAFSLFPFPPQVEQLRTVGK